MVSTEPVPSSVASTALPGSSKSDKTDLPSAATPVTKPDVKLKLAERLKKTQVRAQHSAQLVKQAHRKLERLKKKKKLCSDNI